MQAVNQLISAALMCAVGLGATSASLAGGKGSAYVPNQNGAVTVIDLATMAPSGSLDIGA